MERAFLGETPPLTAANAAKPLAPPSLSPPDSPDLTSVPPRRQLDPYGGKRGGKKRKCVCGLCHGVCHLLSHITLGIVSKAGRLRGDASCEDAALLLVKQRI